MTTANIYGYAFTNFLAAKVNWDSDTIKMALVTSSYTPNLGTDEFWTTPQADELANGSGYTTGGATLAGKSVTLTAANSWGTAWAATTAYTFGQVVRPSTGNGYLYQCVVAGTSAASAPSFPTTVGETVTDGTVTWCCKGESITVVTATAPSWTFTGSVAFEYGVIYDSTPGTAATDPLIAVANFGTVSLPSGTFTANPDSSLGFLYNFPA